MNKCLKITLMMQKIPKDFLKKNVQPQASDLKLEGTAQLSEDIIKIIVCGKKNTIDAFLDGLHKEIANLVVEDLQIEPFLKEKDYRGVFRIIE